MFYLWENYYKPTSVLYYIAVYVSWLTKLILLDLQRNWTYECALGTKFIHV